jgi:hypothetical protein
MCVPLSHLSSESLALVQNSQHVGGKRSRDGTTSVWLSQLYMEQSREEAARTFYDALVLQSKGYIRIAAQGQAYEELSITLLARA